MPVHLQFPDNITDSLPTTCGCPSSAEKRNVDSLFLSGRPFSGI